MTARYQRLADLLREAIADGTYPPGSILPSQAELAEEHGITKTTAGEAIRVLAGEGLVRGVQRRGTVVLDRRPVRVPLSRYQQVLQPGGERGPWEAACAAQGLTGQMQTVEVATEPAPADVAVALGRAEGAQVVRRSRLALLEGTAVQLHTAWYPLDIVQGTPLEQPAKVVGGVYGALTAAGHSPATVDEQITGRPPAVGEKAELGLRGEPVFQIDRVTRDGDGRPLELLRIVANTTRTVLVYDGLPLTRP